MDQRSPIRGSVPLVQILRDDRRRRTAVGDVVLDLRVTFIGLTGTTTASQRRMA